MQQVNRWYNAIIIGNMTRVIQLSFIVKNALTSLKMSMPKQIRDCSLFNLYFCTRILIIAIIKYVVYLQIYKLYFFAMQTHKELIAHYLLNMQQTEQKHREIIPLTLFFDFVFLFPYRKQPLLPHHTRCN